MAIRPVFLAELRPSGGMPVPSREVEFKWHPGLAPVQKRKNVAAIHQAANVLGINGILEVSTKSNSDLGVALSAFNLRIDLFDGTSLPLEGVFQGGKVFERGGPFLDLMTMGGRAVKKDPRLQESGRLVGFQFEGEDWPLLPRTAFYDRLYISAVASRDHLVQGLREFAAFTDVEFNPARSLNCQARSCALAAALIRSDRLDEVLRDRAAFISLYGVGGQSSDGQQATLF